MDLAVCDSYILWRIIKFIKEKIMRKKLILFFIFLIFIFIFAVFYRGLNNSNIYTPDLIKKSDIPVFNAKDFYSNESINSLNIFNSDQTYLLNIWSSWCVPCREEHPFLINLNDIENLTIIGINYKDKKINAKNFLAELNNPYDLILLDEDGTLSIEWGAFGVPETFLIYKKKIIKKVIGPINNKTFDEIKKLIK